MSERPPSPDLGHHLRQLRKARGLSLRAAGAATGISFSRIREYERGWDSHTERPVWASYDQLVKLARAYNTPAEALLRRAGYHAGLDLPEDESRLLTAYRQLPEAARPAAVMAMEAQASYYTTRLPPTTGALAAEPEGSGGGPPPAGT